jgi:hypothetical protein
MIEQVRRTVFSVGLRSSLSVLVLAALTACSEVGEQQTQPLQAQSEVAAERCEVRPPWSPNFEPELEWQWTSSTVFPNHTNVMMTPVVVEVNGDGIPDVVFNAHEGNGYNANGVIRAISGANGQELWTVTEPAYRVRGASSIAAGDIDNDGLAELCTVPESGSGLICFENDGRFKFRISTPDNSWGGPSFADLDGDGTVEILNGNHVFSNTGTLRWAGADGMGGISGTGPISFAADIDQDGRLEVVNDRAIYRHDGSLLCRNTSIGYGLAGVGNFDADPYGEVAVVWSGYVSLLDHDCRLLWTRAIPGGGAGGAPNIADFDNDGQAEVGVAGASNYVVLETNGSIKWASVTRDYSSNRTGSSTFDFEGDGQAEVVYADEVRLRIYDGATGAIRFEVPHSSCTTYENPVIVDVDGDNNAEIVVAANTTCGYGPYKGIRVFRDKRDGWVNTRRIWNQHAYSVTNVNDDGTIPRRPVANWLTPGLNTFRSNSQGTGTTSPFAAADLVASDVSTSCDRSTLTLTVSARVRNQGDAAASAGMKVAFFRGNPASGGTLLGVATVPSVLAAGAETTVSISLNPAPGNFAEVWAIADNDGTGAGREAECREDNNAASANVDLSCRADPRWVQGPSLEGCHAKAYHQSVLLPNGKVFATGGYSTKNDIYDPATGTWAATAPSARARRYHSVTLLPNGKVLVAGGTNGSLDATAELFDPASEAWSAASSMGTARRYHTATLLPNGLVLVAGGGGTGQGHTAELYNPASGTWSATGSLNVARRQHSATLLPNGLILVAGGVNDSGQRLASAELYNPASGTWSLVGNLSRARTWHTATALPGSKVLVAGGIGRGDLTAELFDPASGSWALTGNTVQPRRYHTATLLRSGKVLVAGGYDEYTGIHTSAELYDPATGSWSATVPMHVERYHHTATLLNDGRVLSVGGFSNVDQGATELYEP